MSRSTFAGFTIAQSALNASMSSLQITGQNIANVNTTGYTRQQVDTVSLNLNGSSAKVSIGYGVETTGTSQIRDPFLDVQYRNQIAKAGTANAYQNTLDQLADIFDETDETALKSALSDLSTYLTKLSGDVNVSEYDTIVRSQCETISSFLHQKASSLSTLREETLNELEDTDIPAVNQMLTEISELNESIWNSQVVGSSALELQDQRNSLLDALASYLPISVTYDKVNITDSKSLEYPVVTLKGADGTSYSLTGGEHGETCASLSVTLNADNSGAVSISLTPASDANDPDPVDPVDITDNLENGAIKGITDMLNDSGELDEPATDTRGIGYYEKVLNSFVQTFAETFNTLNEKTGVSSIPTSGSTTAVKSDGNDKAVFSFDFSSSSGNFLSGEEIIINGQTYTFGDGTDSTIAIGDNLAGSLENLANALGSDTLEVNGLEMEGTWTYDSSKKLTWTSSDSLPLDTELTSTGIKLSGGDDLTLTYNVPNYDLFTSSDGSDTITAANIQVSDNWLNNKIKINASTKENAGSTANDNILRMINALDTEKREFTYEYSYVDSSGITQTGTKSIYTGTFSGSYSNLENIQGIDSSENSSNLSVYTSVLSEISDNRDSVSGVNLDEEGVSLLQYQRSYTAAARLMTTLDEALETLLSDTGVVGR